MRMPRDTLASRVTPPAASNAGRRASEVEDTVRLRRYAPVIGPITEG
jgi:hypothetical protein